MSMYAIVDGVQKEASMVLGNDDGVVRRAVSLWANKNGVPTRIWSAKDITPSIYAVSIVGSSVHYYNSKIGTEFTESPLSLTSNIFNTIVYGDGKFVIGSTGRVHWTPDKGATWNQASLPTSVTSSHVCTFGAYVGGRFILVFSTSASGWTGYRSSFVTIMSEDGINWTTGAALSAPRLRTESMFSNLAGNELIVCGYNGFEFALYATKDGTSWEQRTNPAGSITYLQYGTYDISTGRYTVYSSNTEGYYSMDNGVSWTAFTVFGLADGMDTAVHSKKLKKYIVYSETNRTAYISDDGVNYEAIILPEYPEGTDYPLRSCRIVSTKEGFMFMGVYANSGLALISRYTEEGVFDTIDYGFDYTGTSSYNHINIGTS